MDTGTCGEVVSWDVVQASSPLSTLAGVLAGFLVVAATTAIFAPWDRYRWRTVSLFAAGVPALISSSFIFAFIYGTKVPAPGPDSLLRVVYDRRCEQLWGQWLLAAGLLATGSAVLICGFAWLVVGYTENKAKERYMRQIAPILARVLNWDVDTRSADEVVQRFNYIKQDRVSLIRAAGWISAVGIMSAAIILMTIDILYIKAVGLAEWRLALPEKWPAHTGVYLAFLVWGAGIHTVLRTGFVVWARTKGAVEVNKKACVSACKKIVPSAVLNRLTPSKHVDPWIAAKIVERWRQRPARAAVNLALAEAPREIATLAATIYIALVASKHTVHASECRRPGFSCSELTPSAIFDQSSAFLSIGIYFLLLYCCLKALKISIDARLLKHRPKEVKFRRPVDPIELLEANYRHGRPAVVTGHVVASVIFSIGLVGVFFQWDFQVGSVQLGAALSLLVAGLHPFLILRGLAEAVASGGRAPKVPSWKQETQLGLLIP